MVQEDDYYCTWKYKERARRLVARFYTNSRTHMVYGYYWLCIETDYMYSGRDDTIPAAEILDSTQTVLPQRPEWHVFTGGDVVVATTDERRWTSLTHPQ